MHELPKYGPDRSKKISTREKTECLKNLGTKRIKNKQKNPKSRFKEKSKHRRSENFHTNFRRHCILKQST